ncbi:DNA helicase RecQ [Pelotomaculum propionicicum]|uniref:DNA helicase RecQ n=1 Tax=Pelotomaculum propionicicum TaxID=258475 RepID=A0A4Y7RT69_9FIRM|nr:DNA helicase RecQ [Pelotomaculum propionicicum]TEB12198.1 ATP-dependent DNA helicase RecQ [Pelotomaculum propionicicum]
MMQKAAGLLKKYFGYPSFKSGQEQIIGSILQGRDTVGIMPTGGGKSICYQLPALLYGTTLVISPLISLMKDQVDDLRGHGITAAFINSSLDYRELSAVLAQARRGRYKLIYMAPERLESEQFTDMVKELDIQLLAVDEAHCISQWGHDFRPAYLSIAPFVKELKRRPVIAAFTATATTEVTRDMVNLLALDQPNVFVTGFDRANLFFAVINGAGKRDFVESYLAENRDKSGIIYAATRKDVDQIHTFLQQKGFAAGKYHAGMTAPERELSQEQFIYDEIRVMVATNAFGMGIDKSNVRYVIHYHMPKNLEAYYQEAGRAGRDDGPAECILLFSPQDVQIQRFLIESSTASPERRDSEYRKLQSMVDYCHTSRCLRGYILQYFGQSEAPENCAGCSNCSSDRELVDITMEAQKILSCVWRMREQFGVNMVASVLKGSRNKKVLRNGFDKLTSYGLLQDYPEKEIQHLIKVLIAEGYIGLTDGQYPVVRLLPGAAPVLKGEKRVFRQVRLKKSQPLLDQSLFDRLRQLRREIAQREQVPPYIIFSDSTLREMCERLPATPAALLAIKGVGEAKLKNYGSQFLNVLREFAGDTVNQPETGLPRSQKKSVRTASHVVTYNMYKEGHSIKEIARLRDLAERSVEDHIIRCGQEGLDLDWNDLINPQHEQLIVEKIKELGTAKLRPLKEALPEEVSYLSIRAVITKLGW